MGLLMVSFYKWGTRCQDIAMDGFGQGLLHLHTGSVGAGIGHTQTFIAQLLVCQGPSPLQLDNLHGFVRHYPDVQLAAYLVQGLTGGFLHRLSSFSTSPDIKLQSSII